MSSDCKAPFWAYSLLQRNQGMIRILLGVLLLVASLPEAASYLGFGYPPMYPPPPPMYPMPHPPMYPMPPPPMYPMVPPMMPSNTTVDPVTGALTGAIIGGLGGLLFGGL
ncbi:hypothetical protein Y032_0067g12 [Ancylostoma ceylanicum]|uniref:Uncharacterized protein n=1 Tax=Ancylostoma ceylanicum TaxID=53326 RepID=A0A016TZV9_9BILA|nr:hypothetical protein Y032_0067g12 [Ancylostoma ceylanicum]